MYHPKDFIIMLGSIKMRIAAKHAKVWFVLYIENFYRKLNMRKWSPRFVSIRKLVLCKGYRTFAFEERLDSFGKEVPGLGNVVGGCEGASKLVCDGVSGVDCLQKESSSSKHGKTAMLDFLELLGLVLLRGVLEAEGVPPSFTLSKTKVTWQTAGTIFLDEPDTVKFNPDHGSGDLLNGENGNVVKSLSGVSV
jgi:hypothetical protein